MFTSRSKWLELMLAAGLAVALLATTSDANACNVEGCPTLPNTCYSYLLSNNYSNVLKWCQAIRKCNTYDGCWYETHVTWGNASSYGTAVQGAMNSFNVPPRGPGNSLYLDKGGSAGTNDIDFWNAWTTQWWWGMAHWVDGAGVADGYHAGCFGRGGGWVQLNTYRIPADYSWQRWIIEHELGHEVGLGHVCTWGITMNPCSEGNNVDLSSCDAQGIASLYP